MGKYDIRDIAAGLSLTALGVFAALYSFNYNIGNLQRMGSGFFPLSLGVLLAFMGIVILISAFFRSGDVITIQFKDTISVVGSVIFFALTIGHIGFFLTTILTVCIGSLTSKITWIGRLILGICISLFCYATFILGLKMPLPLWPWSV